MLTGQAMLERLGYTDLPVALASGLVTDELVLQAQVLGIREVIYKPHSLEDIAVAMNRMLAGSRSRA
ncbi:MAG: hypothetical protein H7Z19_01945 [Chitinophagaceae bacterium]|nr:hypothetical protein [Rubrivivax sp.]